VTISSSTFTVGSALTTIASAHNMPQRVTVTNLQPGQNVGEMSRDGYVFLAQSRFTIANNGTQHLQITTGPYGVQFEFYEIVAAGSNVSAELLEGATFGSATAVPSYNLNRQSDRVAESTLSAATAVTGGTVISAEFVPASNQAGGAETSVKIHTLEPSTSYVMRFVDAGGNGATCFLQLAFAEQYNGAHDVHLNNTAGSAFVLRGGERLDAVLYPDEDLVASTTGQECTIAVMKQAQ
jgi:hypothetical protein